MSPPSLANIAFKSLKVILHSSSKRKYFRISDNSMCRLFSKIDKFYPGQEWASKSCNA